MHNRLININIAGVCSHDPMSALRTNLLRYEGSADPQLPGAPPPGARAARPRPPRRPGPRPRPHSASSYQPEPAAACQPRPRPRQSRVLSHLWTEASQPSSLSTGKITRHVVFPKYIVCNGLSCQHLQTHAMFRPYICSLCDAGFTSLAQLESHSALHA